ncbi:MAG: hypothetical protein WCH78_08140 [Bacteroidota bacterium]
MPTNHLAAIEINEFVYDRLNVLIKSSSLKKTLLHYCIFNTNQKQIRKGSFVGESIQMNLFHIPDGKYIFNLFDDQGIEISLPFVKQAEIHASTSFLREH